MKTKLLILLASFGLFTSCADQARLAENLAKFNAIGQGVNAYYEAQKPVIEDTK